jgi:hypothetical protein
MLNKPIIIRFLIFLLILIFSLPGIGYSLVEESQSQVISEIQVVPQANTGAATTSIPIVVPPGRKGIAPKLSLTYNSLRRNGWIGVGWSLDMGAIQRNTKRGVDYTANDYVFILDGSSTELVPRGDWGTNY